MNINVLPGALGEIFAQVSETSQLTQADRYGLMAAIVTEAMNEDEQRAMNRLLRSVVRERIQIANEISRVN